ncbi:MAG: TRAP transporter small permease [Roseitalea sp.]|nr:TRAP transporter small permease [Roseitalea sp.]MBO6721347.1 TRAP transporter small permease [Roseitalea sp.]MBO6744532.1 TRAP transporter small permease [Roseitalea sp.]
MSILKKTLDHISEIALFMAAIVAGLMMIHVSADVIAKRLFNAPIIGTLEAVSLYYMLALVFLPLGVIQRDRGHVFIELFTQNIGDRARRFLDAIALLFMLVLTVLLVWKGTEVAVEKTQAGELSQNLELAWQVWPGRWLPVIGFTLTAIYALIYLISESLFLLSGSENEVPDKHTPDDDGGF